jgi:hypothetical protein
VGAVDGAELGEDDLQALLDGDLAAAELAADLAVGQSLGGELEDIAIFLGKVGVALRLLARETLEILQHGIEQLRAELATTANRAADGGNELIRRGRFEEIAVCSGLEGLADIGLIAIGGQDDDGRADVLLAQAAGRLNAAGAGHA